MTTSNSRIKTEADFVSENNRAEFFDFSNIRPPSFAFDDRNSKFKFFNTSKEQPKAMDQLATSGGFMYHSNS